MDTGGLAISWWREYALTRIMPPRGAEYPEGNVIPEVVKFCRGRTLDFGCGRGRLAPFFPVKDYVGYDISEKALKEARRLNPDHEFTNKLPLADTVMAYTVLHHIVDFEPVCRQFHDYETVVIAEIMDPRWKDLKMPPCINREPEEYIRLFPNYDLIREDHPNPCYPDTNTTILAFSRSERAQNTVQSTPVR